MSLKESYQDIEDDSDEDNEFPVDLSEWMIIDDDDDDDDDDSERGENESLHLAEVKESETKESPRQSRVVNEEKRDKKSNNKTQTNLAAVDKTQQQKNITVKDLPKPNTTSNSTTAASKKVVTKPAASNNAKALVSVDQSKLPKSDTPIKKAVVTQRASIPVSVPPSPSTSGNILSARPGNGAATSCQPSAAQKKNKPQTHQTAGASSVKSPKSSKQKTLVTDRCAGKLAISASQIASKISGTKASTATTSDVSKSANVTVKPETATGMLVGKCLDNPTVKVEDSISSMKTGASKQASSSNSHKSDSCEAGTKRGNIVSGTKDNITTGTPSTHAKQTNSSHGDPLSTKTQTMMSNINENPAHKTHHTSSGEKKLVTRKSALISTTAAVSLSTITPLFKGTGNGVGTKPTTSDDSQKRTSCGNTDTENQTPKKTTSLHDESKPKKAGTMEESSAIKLAPSTKAVSKGESYSSNIVSSIAEAMEMEAGSHVYQVVDEYDSISAEIGGMNDVEDISDTELANIMQYENKSSEFESKKSSQKRSPVDGASGPVSKKSRHITSISTDTDEKDVSSTVQASKRKDAEALKKVMDNASPKASKKVLKKADTPASVTTASSSKRITKSSSPKLSDTKVTSAVNKPGKRIIRRFHRMTQTMGTQHKHKLAQCRIRVPSLDAPNKSLHNKSVQTWSQEELELNKASYLDVAVIPNALPDSVSPEIFNTVSSFNINNIDQRLFGTTTFEYGISLGQISSSDVFKAPFRDSILKKAYAHSINFIGQDEGVVDLYFSDEDSFIAMLIQARKIRIGSRYLVFTVFKNLSVEERKQTCGVCSVKSTVVYDQNFLSSGFLTYMKAPAWNKPRVEETVTIHNIPEGIPLSFLSLIIPDAVTLEVEGEKQEITKSGCRVRMGMNRKTGSDQLLKLFHQIYINNEPLFLSTAKTEADVLSQVKEAMNSNELRRDEINQRLSEARSVLRDVKATPRDINKEDKVGVKKETVEVFMEVQNEPCQNRVLMGSSKLGPTRISTKKTVIKKPLGSNKKGVARALGKHVKMHDNQQDLSDISDSSDIGDFGVAESGRKGKAHMSEAARQKTEERPREHRSGNKIERDEYSSFPSQSNVSNRQPSPFSRALDHHEGWQKRKNQYPQRGDESKAERFDPRNESEWDRVGCSRERESIARGERRLRKEEEDERFISRREDNRGKLIHVRQGRIDRQDRLSLEGADIKRRGSLEPVVEGGKRGWHTYDPRGENRNSGRHGSSNANEDLNRVHQEETNRRSGAQGSFRDHNVSTDFGRVGLYNRGERNRHMEPRHDRGSRDRSSGDTDRGRVKLDSGTRDERRIDTNERDTREKRGVNSREREQYDEGNRERERYIWNVKEVFGDKDMQKMLGKTIVEMVKEDPNPTQNRHRPVRDAWKQETWQRRDRSPLTRKVIRRRSASPKRKIVPQKYHISRRLSRSPPKKTFRKVTLVRRSSSPKSRKKGSALSPISVGDDDEFSGGMWLSPPLASGSSTSKKNVPPDCTDRKSSPQKDQWMNKNVPQNESSRFLTSSKQSGSESKDPSTYMISTHHDPIQYLAQMRETFGSGVNFVSSEEREKMSTKSSELPPPADGEGMEERYGNSEGKYRPLYQPKSRSSASTPIKKQDLMADRSHRIFDPSPNKAGPSDIRGDGRHSPALNEMAPFPSGPPPIPPPVAPPLFTGPLSSQDKFNQMTAMAKQLAEDILSQQEPPQQGTWKAPPFSTAASLQTGLGPSPSPTVPSFQTPHTPYSGPLLLSGPPVLGSGASQYTGPPTFSVPPPNIAAPPPAVVPISHTMGMPNVGMPPPNMGMPIAGTPLVARPPAPQNTQSQAFTRFVNDSVFF